MATFDDIRGCYNHVFELFSVGANLLRSVSAQGIKLIELGIMLDPRYKILLSELSNN